MSGPGGWFALIDTAQDSDLFGIVKRCRQQQCLFSGDVPPEMAAASPYLVRVDDRDPLMPAWQQRGVGRNWGLLCEARIDFDALRSHFRRFLQARLPDGTVALFRFYDPRVFNTYLPAATADEQARWFDGVKQYSVEGADGVIHSYRLIDGLLHDGEAAVGG